MCVYRCTSHSCGDLRNVCLHDSRRILRFSVCGVVGTKSAQAEERVSRATLERNFTRNSRNLERCWNARFDIVQGRRNAAKAFNNTITNACSVSLVPPRNIEFYPEKSNRSFPRLRNRTSFVLWQGYDIRIVPRRSGVLLRYLYL